MIKKKDTAAVVSLFSLKTLQPVCRNYSGQHREAFYLKRPRISRNQYQNSGAVCFNMAKKKRIPLLSCPELGEISCIFLISSLETFFVLKYDSSIMLIFFLIDIVFVV